MIVRVLPLPAPANTSSGPSPWVTACIWGSLSSGMTGIVLGSLANLAATHIQDKSDRSRIALRSGHAPAAPAAPDDRSSPRRRQCRAARGAFGRAAARRMRLLCPTGHAPLGLDPQRRRVAARGLLRRVRRASGEYLFAR